MAGGHIGHIPFSRFSYLLLSDTSDTFDFGPETEILSLSDTSGHIGDMAAKMTGHKKTQVGHIAFAPLRAINARSWMHIALLPDVGFRLWDLGYRV